MDGSVIDESDKLTMRRALQVVAIAIILHIVIGWAMRTAGISWGEDDAGYLQLASELRHGSYREIQDVLRPWHARFPPVFPAIIAIVGAPLGDRFDPLIGVLLLMTAGSLLLLFDATRRVFGNTVAACATLLYAVNPTVITDSGWLMSEAPFRLFVVWAMWALVRDRENESYAKYAVIAVILAALTRTAGVVFLPALALHWALQRRWRLVATYMVAVSATVGLWMLWTFVAPEGDDRILYTAAFSDVVPATVQSPVISFVRGLLSQVARIPERVMVYATNFGPSALGYPAIPGTPIDNLLLDGLSIILAGVGLVVGFRRWRPVMLMLTSYLLLLLLWRHALVRFVSPIIPVLFVTLLVGVQTLASRFRTRNAHLGVWIFTGLLLVGAAHDLKRQWESRRGCDRNNVAESAPCWSREYREYLKVAQWVRDSVPPEALFVTSKERAFFYHSGRLTIAQNGSLKQDSTTYVPYLRSRGVTHTVVTKVGVRSVEHNGLVASSCQHFTTLKAFPNGSLVLRLLSEGEAQTDPSTCSRLAPFKRVIVWDPVEKMNRLRSAFELREDSIK